jgi:pyruvate dehydrogenase E2 component (dihydrolipoamide acetyltransferase)
MQETPPSVPTLPRNPLGRYLHVQVHISRPNYKLNKRVRVDWLAKTGSRVGMGMAENGRSIDRDKSEEDQGLGSIKIMPLTRMMKTIIKRLSYSERNTLRVTMTMEVDMTRAIKLREKLIREVLDARVSYTDIIVKATVDALKQNPILNSRLEGAVIKIFERIHISVAVALESGLIVPVIRDADGKSLTEIAHATKALVEKARNGNLSLEEVTGGAFTITNLGSFGVDLFTPIINPPQSAILAVGRISVKPVVAEGEIVTRQMMTISLSFDHRIIDGVEAAKFLQGIKNTLESPQHI